MKLVLPIGLAVAACAVLLGAGLDVLSPGCSAPLPAAPNNAADLAQVEEADLVRPPPPPQAPPPHAVPEVHPDDPMARYLSMDRSALVAERAAVAERQAASAARQLGEHMELGLFEERTLPEGEAPRLPDLDEEGARAFHLARLERSEGGRCTWHVASLTAPESPDLQADQELLRWIDWRLAQLSD